MKGPGFNPLCHKTNNKKGPKYSTLITVEELTKSGGLQQVLVVGAELSVAE